MRRKKRIFITVGILINVLLCLGLYVNYKLDHIVAGLNKPGVTYKDTLPDDSANGSSADRPSSSVTSPGKNGTSTPGTSTPSNSSSPGKIAQPSTQDITNGVQQKLGQPVEKKDLIKGGMIIMRKLNWDEITFLYNAGSKAQPSPEELKQAREILKGKLSTEELATLQALGGKYGQSLNFLN